MTENLKQALRNSIKACSDRGLCFASKWAAEQLTGLSKSFNLNSSVIPLIPASFSEKGISSFPISIEEQDAHLLAKIYFDLKEYKRCAWVLKDCNSTLNLFLWGYATYLAGEKQLQDALGPVFSDSDTNQHKNNALPSILEKLKVHFELYPTTATDPWLLYLKGLILYKARNTKSSMDVLIKSVTLYSFNWSAWTLLAQCMTSEVIFQTTKKVLPDSILKYFFITYTILHQHFDTKEAWEAFSYLGTLFSQSTTVAGYRAQLFYEERNLRDSAIQFDAILKLDPYRMDGIDIYGNALFVLQEKAELCRLCQSAIEIDKHRPETYICIGNFYSCKNQHESAAEYLRRAISLNRANPMAWILLGHELLELNMTEASTEAYRRATDLNPREFQAWFGLGHIYNLLQLYPFAVEYSRRSLAIRPKDGRIWANLANIFRKMGRTEDAKVAAERSVQVDAYYLDPNMFALLGKLWEESMKLRGEAEGGLTYHASTTTDTTTDMDMNNLNAKKKNSKDDSNQRHEQPLHWYQKAWEERHHGTIPLNTESFIDTLVYLTKHALLHHQSSLVTMYMDSLMLYPDALRSEKIKLLQSEIRDRMQSISSPSND